MKKIFTLKDKKSDKFWTIDLLEKKLITTYGKVKNANVFTNWYKNNGHPTHGPSSVRFGEDGSISEKEFENIEQSRKEYDKAITKKIKEGYIEQEELFIDLDEGMQMFQNGKLDIFFDEERIDGVLVKPIKIDEGMPKNVKILISALEELDRRDSPLEITYGVHLFIQYISIALEYKHRYNQYLDFKDIINFIYHLPKLQSEKEEIILGLKTLYGYGLHISIRENVSELNKFCLEHLNENNEYEKELIENAKKERCIYHEIYDEYLESKK
jgi:predicted DNA-binding WGR domain protein